MGKNLKKLADEILNLETIIQKSRDEEEVKKAKVDILRLSKYITNFEDMIIIDEIIQKKLSKKY